MNNAVQGQSTNATAIGAFNNSSADATLYAENDSSSGFPLFVENKPNGQSFGVGSNGSGYFSGAVYATGFNTTLRTRDGEQVQAYGMKSADDSIEETGSGELIGGRADIALERGFIRTINTAVSYRVFITPDGDTRGLFVSRKSPEGFEVRESQGGRSNISFDYRVVAQPLGAEPSTLPSWRAVRPRHSDIKAR